MQSGGSSGIINVLPQADTAVIPIEKFTKYSLNSIKNPDKAFAFEKALGYNTSNADRLVNNIRENIKNFNAVDKGATQYGHRYEVLMTITGENMKTANIKTGWVMADTLTIG